MEDWLKKLYMESYNDNVVYKKIDATEKLNCTRFAYLGWVYLVDYQEFLKKGFVIHSHNNNLDENCRWYKNCKESGCGHTVFYDTKDTWDFYLNIRLLNYRFPDLCGSEVKMEKSWEDCPSKDKSIKKYYSKEFFSCQDQSHSTLILKKVDEEYLKLITEVIGRDL